MAKKLLIVLLAVVMLTGCTAQNTHTITGTVTNIDEQAIYIDLDDGTGWVADYVPGYEVGQRVSLTVDGCGTESIYDDALISID
jgi:uncharacterized protein YceK